jgi:DNA processing protein
MLFTRVSDFLDEMQWKDTSGTAGRTVQLDLLPELDPSSTLLVHLLGKHGILPLDQLYILSGLESGTAAKAILDLELGGIIKLLPGKRYALA